MAALLEDRRELDGPDGDELDPRDPEPMLAVRVRVLD